jgi:hypothetical protein
MDDLTETRTWQEAQRVGLVSLALILSNQAPGLLAKRYDPKMAILSLFVLMVLVLVRTHKDQVEQNFMISVRTLDVTCI